MEQHQYIKNKFKGAGAAGVVGLPHSGLNAALSTRKQTEVRTLFPLKENLFHFNDTGC